SDVGTVGGGASWRMIVDLADTQHSRGVYPGGQSGDPTNSHYDDQIAIWAAGRYLPLNAVSDPQRLPPDTQRVKQTFVAQ
ncbi:MAG TPA: penicillin acylase family protein, partial [Planctomycetaceae bacterium]|nr:penicillin acylase family protein [Planctomycetaceae bacterium]